MQRRSNSDGGNDGCRGNAMNNNNNNNNNNKQKRRSDSPSPQSNNNNDDGATNAAKTNNYTTSNRNKKKKTKYINAPSAALVITTTTSAPSSPKLANTPISLLIGMIGYLDNASLMALCLVSKQFCTIIRNGHGMDNKLVRVFELRCSKVWNYYRFILHMKGYFADDHQQRILQGHQHLKVHDVCKFNDYCRPDTVTKCKSVIVRMTGIVSLDISSPLPISGDVVPTSLYHVGSLPQVLSYMLPNLQQLDCSHTRMSAWILEEFALQCPRLEIIKRNNIPDGSIDHDHLNILADGYNLRMTSNLKEIYFDNCFFEFVDEFEEGEDIEDDEDMEYAAMTNLKKYPKLSLLYLLCKDNSVLERVSMRNARRSKFNNPQQTQTVLPQDALIKFVRNAPSTLNWFRSDLSAANIQVLQLEKPGIQFLN